MTTLAYLAYLGFPGSDVRDGVRITGSKTKEKSSRDVFHILVIGPSGSGKVGNNINIYE
jgi:hypothetical protein